MKTRIVVGATLLLSLGSAVAGSMLYGQGQDRARADEPAAATVTAETVTPAMIAEWKANSSTSDYIAPRVPI
jgi:hypothetical protein